MLDMILPTYLTSPLLDLWMKETDPFVRNYWLCGNPFSMLTAAMLIVMTIHCIAPHFTPSFQHRDLRPLMLIVNGFVFGIVGMGLCLGVIVTNFTTYCFSCDASDPSRNDIMTAATKMIAFMYIMTKLLEFQRPLFAVLRGDSASSHYRSFSYTLFLLCQLVMTYIGVVFYPGGALTFWPVADGIVLIMEYGYMVLKLATPQLQPNPSWKNVIFRARLCAIICLIIHSYIGRFECSKVSYKLSVLLGIAYYYNVLLLIGIVSITLIGLGRQETKVGKVPTISSSKGLRINDACNNNNNNNIKRSALEGH